MEVSTHQSGFGCYGSYDSRPSYSGLYDEQYNDHTMPYDCVAPSENDFEEESISETASSSSSSADYQDDDCGEMEMDDCIDQGDVHELAASTEMLRIRFPFQSISVRLSDFCCLREKDLINDTMIDFCLNHIVEHILPDDPSRRVTVLPSVFWHNLSLLDAATQDPELGLVGEKLWDARFHDVLDFVEGFDLQEVDYIVIPISDWDHWSLAVVCHPFKTSGRIVYFDSQPKDFCQEANCRLISDFLQYAWLQWRGLQLAAIPFTIPANLPQQSQPNDSGVFILEFARRFLLQPAKNLCSFDFSSQYKDFTISTTRVEMQRVVLSLSTNRSTWEPLMALLNRSSEN